MDMAEKEMSLSRFGNHESYLGYLDLMDREALENWRSNVNYLNKVNKLRETEGQQVNWLNRIVDMYKIYGTESVALVNPKENPYIL